MEPEWDVIVVGAGPAGSLAAMDLVEQGWSVALLEKEELPRYKPCGGGIPPHAVRMLEDREVDLETKVEDVAEDVRFLYDFDRPVDRSLGPARVTMVNRRDFDELLARTAEDRGARLKEGVAVRELDRIDAGCRLTDEEGRTWTARYVVGADGANSRIARQAGLDVPPAGGVALDAEIEVNASTYEEHASRAIFNIDAAPKGYGWVFPKQGYLALGVGGYQSDVSYPDQLDRFVDRTLPAASILDRRDFGHPLPYYQPHPEAAGERVALVGDAASLVDALSGEGIYYAMKSGELAAGSIGNALEKGTPDLTGYADKLRESMGRDLALSARLASVFFRFPEQCYRHGVERPIIVEKMKQVVAGGQYGDIFRELWDEIIGRLEQSTLGSLGWSS